MMRELCVCVLIAAFWIPSTHGHMTALDRHHVVSGHFLQLECGDTEERTNVTWTRGGSPGVGLPAGVEVRGGSLWFLQTQPHHAGPYTCQISDQGASWEMQFAVSVDSGLCPDPAEFRTLTKGTTEHLFCKQKQVFSLDSTAHIQWLKDCRPVEGHDKAIRVFVASERDAGVYTCLVNFSLEGKYYSSSRSMHLNITDDALQMKPHVIYPRHETLEVDPGSRVELRCSAFVGEGFDSSEVELDTMVHWTVNDELSSTFVQLNNSWKFVYEKEKVYLRSNLTIPEVLPEFLGVPIRCVVTNPLDQDVGLLWLKPANHSGFYTCVGLPVAFLVVILAVAACCLFKVDLVLVYRKLRPHVFKKRKTPDGKLYDGYVSCLHGDATCSSSAMTFALQILPEVLERRHGYTLYIRGRDDSPGEAVHDAIAESIRRSRRLIIVLSAQSECPVDAETKDTSPLRQSQDQQGYEQRIGLYDALIQNGLPVILVETAPVDSSSLPESLRYLRRRQGALRWRSGSANSPTLHPNGHFWKRLRYHMPSEPGGKPLTGLWSSSSHQNCVC